MPPMEDGRYNGLLRDISFFIPYKLYGHVKRQTINEMKIFISNVLSTSHLISPLQCIFMSHSLRDIFAKDIDKEEEC